MAEMLSRDLAHRGLIILSGMARGVDTSAHKGSLAAEGPTIAVWGRGIDVIYPKENKSLSAQIIAAEALSCPSFRYESFLRRKLFLNAIA
jgi:DNA processing protein